MTILNCPNCGGTHYGSTECPYISVPCVVCSEPTILACADCAIDSGGRNRAHVCAKPKCRDAHEAEVHGTTVTSTVIKRILNWIFTPRGAMIYFGVGYASIIAWLLWNGKP